MEDLRLFKKKCSPSNQKVSVSDIISFVKTFPEEGYDCIAKHRDMLNHVPNKEEKILFLAEVAKRPEINSHERSYLAVTIFNHGYIEVCYSCFAVAVTDPTMLVQYRIEASKYLFMSEVDSYIELAKNTIKEIVTSHHFDEVFRYRIIASFLSRTGISTLLNAEKIKVPMNKSFVKDLLLVFFNDQENSTRGRILAASALVELEEESCITWLLNLAKDTAAEEDERADAADVLIRLGPDPVRREALRIITDLGFGARDDDTGEFFRKRNFYQNRQNVHTTSIIESAKETILRIVTENQRPFYEAHAEVVALIGRSSLEHKNKMFKALDRISVDTATFTDRKITLSQVFISVWERIRDSSKPEEKQELEKRLCQELIDMSNTCATGHMTKLVNVLSVYDNAIKISWRDQIEANIAGRVQARMKKEQNAEDILVGMLDTATEEEKQIYRIFLFKVIPEIREEMHDEFKEYMSSIEFFSYFEEAASKWT